jgi:hypothetical protein
METIKSLSIIAIRRIFFTVFTLVIVHHVENISAFPLHTFQLKNTPTNKVKSHNERTNHPSRKACGKSRIFSKAVNKESSSVVEHRRRFLAEASTILLSNNAVSILTTMTQPTIANAAGELPDQFNVDDYLKTGMVMNPMGVSGQAGKSKPVTGMYVL